MKIWNALYDIIFDRIMEQANIEFRGCHSPNHGDGEKLWGRAAYYMIDSNKVTFPVSSMRPRESTLRAGLKAELRRRFEAIEDVVETNEYGEIYVRHADPYSVEPLLRKYARGYVPVKNREAA